VPNGAKMPVGPTVAVVIVNWNGGKYIGRCLEALACQTRPPHEVVVVDNASADDSPALVEQRYPWARLLRNTHNAGFGAGCNLGARATSSDLVATLNPDTQPEPRWLESLVGAASESDSREGMWASLMLFMAPAGLINSAGIAIDVLGIAWDRLGGQPAEPTPATVEVFGPCAGAALYRRSLLEQIGGFDEDYFLYLEDVDLAWRAQAVGWRCRFVPEALVYHVHSAAAVEGSPLKNRLLGRSKVRLIAKNYPWPQVALWGPLILGYDALAVGLACSRGDFASLRGRLEGVAGLPGAVTSRAAAGAGRPDAWQNVRRLMLTLQSPWAIRRRFTHLYERRAQGEAK
jgi:GT2 family glycosyltransferase